jgi:hypothetical protein
MRLALDLFRRHIGDTAHDLLGTLLVCTLCHQGDAKVTEEDFVTSAYQHVLTLSLTLFPE